MEYKVQIGQVAFLITTPCPYPWSETDQRFLHWDGTAVRTVTVNIRWTLFDEPEWAADKDLGFTRIRKTADGEWRSYRAAFWPGHPCYAVSHRCGDRVDIDFCGDTRIWSHPNMQLWNLIHLEQFLLESGGIVLHSCYTVYDGKAILFTAPSGTGKTTQANIWKRVYGSRIVNGDLTLLQRTEKGWFACGFPHHGSADECFNERWPIAAIAIVRQAPEDRVEQIGPAQRLGLLYSECTVNSWDGGQVTAAMELLTSLVLRVPTVMLHCTMEDTAAHVLHNFIFGEKNGTV